MDITTAKRIKIKSLYQSEPVGQKVVIKGWVRTFRSNRFIALNDGSTIKTFQAVVDNDNTDNDLLKRITTGAAIGLYGEIVESQGKGQAIEMVVEKIVIFGDSNADAANGPTYPLQPKRHSLEYLREM